MFRSRLGLIAAISLLALAAGAAEAQGNLKIGVVNVAQLLQQAPQAQAIQKKLEDEFGPREREIIGMRNTLQTKQQTFQRDSAVMGEAERLNLERQIRDGERDLQRTQNEYLEDLNIRRNEELGNLQRSLLQQVQAYARSAQYDIVLADVLYFSNAVDITPAVIAALQKESGGN